MDTFSFFGVGPFELIFVLIIALVVLGPERLPQVARELFKFMGMLRNLYQEIRQQLEQEFGDLEELKELRDLNPLAPQPKTAAGADKKATTPSEKPKPAAAKPAAAKPAAAKPAAAKPAAAQPADAQPAAAQPADAQPAAAQPADAQPADAQPADENQIGRPVNPAAGHDLQTSAQGDPQPPTAADSPAPSVQPASSTAAAATNTAPPDGKTLGGEGIGRSPQNQAPPSQAPNRNGSDFTHPIEPAATGAAAEQHTQEPGSPRGQNSAAEEAP